MTQNDRDAHRIFGYAQDWLEAAAQDGKRCPTL